MVIGFRPPSRETITVPPDPYWANIIVREVQALITHFGECALLLERRTDGGAISGLRLNKGQARDCVESSLFSSNFQPPQPTLVAAQVIPLAEGAG